MSKVFDDIKNFLNDWWIKNGPKVEGMVKTTAEKAEHLTQKTRLKYDLYQAGRDLAKAYEELGEKVYHDMSENKKFDFSGDDDIQVLMDRIVLGEKKVQEIRDELSQVGMSPEEDPFEEEAPEDIAAADVPETDETKPGE
ncbi:TPA: hypothetical protein DCG86_07930 [Candidatus Marinimicrobia bacterium]|nr:MAG: hypothetical protein XD77_0297 [Marinimicrobia bacterium 46_47]KUK91665.1 MAG: hypothetical protein XE04_0935 [Marinimicrobia bacterium 46_43]HAE87937.1 hypothetical protein [Candidatus Neomarinimicrobiota bacterium]HBY18728.1 hypothetical protein [Candidatus Neomarinimicrobiota bacterium]